MIITKKTLTIFVNFITILDATINYIKIHFDSQCGGGSEIIGSNIHCEFGKLPLLYLGPPVGAKARSMAIWNPMIERAKKKLSMWKS